MGTLSEAENDETIRSRKGPPCTVGIALSQLDKADASTLLEWLADDKRQHVWIARALRKHADTHVQPAAISRHRNGECGCNR